MVKMHDSTKGGPVRGRDAVNADPLRYPKHVTEGPVKCCCRQPIFCWKFSPMSVLMFTSFVSNLE